MVVLRSHTFSVWVPKHWGRPGRVGNSDSQWADHSHVPFPVSCAPNGCTSAGRRLKKDPKHKWNIFGWITCTACCSLTVLQLHSSPVQPSEIWVKLTFQVVLSLWPPESNPVWWWATASWSIGESRCTAVDAVAPPCHCPAPRWYKSRQCRRGWWKIMGSVACPKSKETGSNMI